MITTFLQLFWKGWITIRKCGVIIPCAVLMYVQAAEKRITGRRADRIYRVMILIGYAILRQCINIRRVDVRIAIAAQTILSKLVEMKDQDVRLVHISVLSGGMGFLTAGHVLWFC